MRKVAGFLQAGFPLSLACGSGAQPRRSALARKRKRKRKPQALDEEAFQWQASSLVLIRRSAPSPSGERPRSALLAPLGTLKLCCALSPKGPNHYLPPLVPAGEGFIGGEGTSYPLWVPFFYEDPPPLRPYAAAPHYPHPLGVWENPSPAVNTFR